MNKPYQECMARYGRRAKHWRNKILMRSIHAKVFVWSGRFSSLFLQSVKSGGMNMSLFCSFSRSHHAERCARSRQWLESFWGGGILLQRKDGAAMLWLQIRATGQPLCWLREKAQPRVTESKRWRYPSKIFRRTAEKTYQARALQCPHQGRSIRFTPSILLRALPWRVARKGPS